MKLRIGNVYTKAVKIKPREEAILSKAMSFEVPRYQYMPQYLEGNWDGTKKFYHKGYKTFLTGLLPFVLNLAKKEQLTLRLVDDRKPIRLKAKNIRAALKILRPHQKPELKAILSTTLRDLPWIRGVIKHPTGSGKTYVIASLLRAINRRALVIVDGLELLHQTTEDLQKALQQPIGMVGGNKFELEKFTVATMQTLKSRIFNEGLLEYLETVKCVIADECHRVMQKSKKKKEDRDYHTIFLKCPNAYFRLGTSATPLVRGDLGDVTLVGDTGEIISRLQRQQLEKSGVLSRAYIHIIPITSPIILGRSYPTAYHQGIVRNEERNEIIVEEALKGYAKGEIVVVLYTIRSHGRTLYRMLKSHRDIRTVLLHGETDIHKRRRVFKRLRLKPEPIILVVSKIMDQGVNVPDIRNIILAGGGASRIKSIQRVGRGTRLKSDGNNRVHVTDFMDKTHDYLRQHSEERLAAYEAEGFTLRS